MACFVVTEVCRHEGIQKLYQFAFSDRGKAASFAAERKAAARAEELAGARESVRRAEERLADCSADEFDMMRRKLELARLYLADVEGRAVAMDTEFMVVELEER